MKPCFICLLLLAGSLASPSLHAEATPLPAGEWVWVIKEGHILRVMVLKDGTCYLANAEDKGTWRFIAEKNSVEFKWGNGAIDTLAFKNSKSVLEGSNSGGDKIMAVKLP